jgi:glycerophosphoryl diester phosphodiesterase
MTSDDSLIINHDPDFKGLEIEKRTYAELLKFPLSNGEKIPTLREYLRAGMQKNNHTKLICEIKPSGISKERGKQIAVKVVSMVNELGAAKITEYISFDYDILLQVLAIEKTAITFYLAEIKIQHN